MFTLTIMPKGPKIFNKDKLTEQLAFLNVLWRKFMFAVAKFLYKYICVGDITNFSKILAININLLSYTKNLTFTDPF